VARRAELEQQLAAAQATETELDLAEQEHAPRLAAAQQAWFELSGLAERLRGCRSVAAERHRLLSAPPEPQRPGRDPDELDREAAALREQEAALGGQLSAARGQLAAGVSGRTEAEAALSALDRQLAQDARAAVTRAERLARLRGQVEAARATAAAARDEGGRLAEALAQARTRAEHAQLQYGQVQDLASGREQGRSELAAVYEQATAALAAASARSPGSRPSAGQRRRAGCAPGRTLTEAVKRGADASGLLGEPVQRGGQGVRRAAHRRGRRRGDRHRARRHGERGRGVGLDAAAEILPAEGRRRGRADGLARRRTAPAPPRTAPGPS
jgi:chromosome segregation protein